jgi:hypothetical protein
MAAIFWNTGISGNWSVASNWNPNTVPGNSDSATIDAGGAYTVTVDSSRDVNSLTFNAPNAIISIPTSNLFLDAMSATITGGTIDGTGKLFTGGGAGGGIWTISASAPLTLGGGLTFEVFFSTDVVNDAGTINIGDAAGLAATIENFGTFNLTTDTAGIGLNTVNVGGSLKSGIGNFENSGKLAKTGGTGTSRVFASYTSSANGVPGSISVSTGTLEFDGPTNDFTSGTCST